MAQTFPQIFLTRTIQSDNSLYFGPYPRAKEARLLLDAVIKTFQIRDCQQDIQFQIQKSYSSCLSVQIQHCVGPCLRKITPHDYQKRVKQACAFLEGKQSEMILTLKKEMTVAAKKLNFELASEKRDLIIIAQKIQKGVFLKKKIPFQKILSSLKKQLGLRNLPFTIECFDVSHLSGTNNVSAMTVFQNGRPLKTHDRFFKIKTVSMNNDFACLSETLQRRYQQCFNQKEEWPDLIIIDGGKGHLSTSIKVLEKYFFSGDIIALAKKNEWIYTPERKNPIVLPKKTIEIQFLQTIRDRTHQNAVNFHRKIRSQNFLSSPLSHINGIGTVLEKKLLKKFKTIDKICRASEKEMIQVKGISVALAKKITHFLSQLF